MNLHVERQPTIFIDRILRMTWPEDSAWLSYAPQRH